MHRRGNIATATGGWLKRNWRKSAAVLTVGGFLAWMVDGIGGMIETENKEHAERYQALKEQKTGVVILDDAFKNRATGIYEIDLPFSGGIHKCLIDVSVSQRGGSTPDIAILGCPGVDLGKGPQP